MNTGKTVQCPQCQRVIKIEIREVEVVAQHIPKNQLDEIGLFETESGLINTKKQELREELSATGQIASKKILTPKGLELMKL